MPWLEAPGCWPSLQPHGIKARWQQYFNPSQNCFEFTWALIGEIPICNRSKDFVGLVPWALSFLQTVVLKQVMPKIEVLGLRRLHTEGVQPINKQATLCNLVRDY